MRMSNLIIFVYLVIILASGNAIATDVNTTVSLANEESISSTKQITSRFSEERGGFETNLIMRIPAPQEYEAEVPPAGIKEVFYDSGDLKLKAWLLDKPVMLYGLQLQKKGDYKLIPIQADYELFKACQILHKKGLKK